ncbi:MAG TPA: hypothetical protein DDX40_03580 [Rikenellaceae bacterium]|nr:hypothetical protein [Rikenellaceae bacterium]
MLKASELIIGHRGNKAFGPLSFEYSDGQSVMLCGPNGSGKSTLMKTIAGLLPPVSGRFSACGTIVMVPTHIPKVKGFSVKEFIRTSLFTASGTFRKLNHEAETTLEESIRTLGIESLSDKDISLISDGEFQKACIATALTRKANVILLDEPTAFLDVDNRVMVLRTLQNLARDTGTTVIFSTHDIYDGSRFSDATLDLGSISATF